MSEIKHLVTLSDHNYLINGVCLYESLSKYSPNFVLHYLCLNDQTYDQLSSLQLPHLKCYNITELHNDKDYDTLKKNNSSRPIDTSDGQSHFHWALASFFSGYLIANYDLPHVLYVDSDILFYDSVDKIFNAVAPKSIGIITHKHNKLDKNNTNVGYYNVGVIYFKNDEVGSSCLNFWRNCCIHPNNKYSAIFGACGDQKYLELFDDLFGTENVKVLCKKVGNGAPWNFPMFEFIGANRIIWRDPEGNVLNPDESLEQDLVFNHFSHFTPNYDEPSFRFDRGGEWGPVLPSHPGVVEIYVEYFKSLFAIKERYKL